MPEHQPLTSEERAEIRHSLSRRYWTYTPYAIVERLLADLEAAERAILSVPEWATLLTDGVHTCLFCQALHDEGHKPGCAWVVAKERQA